MKRSASALQGQKRKAEAVSSDDSDDWSGSESGPEQQGNGDDDDSDQSEAESVHSNNAAEEADIPLYKRLAQNNSEETVTAVARERVKQRRVKDSAKGTPAQLLLRVPLITKFLLVVRTK
jgi:rubrerythrin